MLEQNVINALVEVGAAVSEIVSSAKPHSMKKFEKEAENLRLRAALSSLKDMLDKRLIGNAWRAVISEMEETASFLRGKDMGPHTEAIAARILQAQYSQLERTIIHA